jgi:hypothetical protein
MKKNAAARKGAGRSARLADRVRVAIMHGSREHDRATVVTQCIHASLPPRRTDTKLEHNQ